jgi:hypothetical protein
MITAQELKVLQIRQPFRPFTLHLSDGRTIELLHPERFLVTRGSVHVGLPTNREIAEKTERFALLHITSIELAETAA